MSHERTPLTTQAISGNGSSSSQGENQSSHSPYGVIEIGQSTTQSGSKSRLQGGIASAPIIALIAVGVALALVFGVTFILPQDQQISQKVLQQSPSNNEGDANGGSTFKDITIPQGRLRGFTKKSRQGKNYTAYYKVPYAEPPLGELRFKDPIPPRSSWEGLRSIPDVARQCIQKEKYSKIVEAVGVEDCLYANIYVPHTPQEEVKPLPVMVYIHGGGFTDGNGSRYGADYFMDEPVILITFQFRLGAFGFLNTQDDVIHGNMGLKDQVQMLVWTRDNIKYFGGDPNKVTIFGNSGGGLSVSFLMLSPMARGLFHRAISQSGANVCAGVPGGQLDLDPNKTVKEVGRVLQCDTGNSTAFLECIRTKDAVDIALVRTPPTKYALTIETRKDNQVFMPDTPYNILKTNPIQVPYIVGVVNAEWTGRSLNLLRDTELVKQLNDDFGKAGGSLIDADLSEEELLNAKKFYFGDKSIGNNTLREVINMVSDAGGMIHCSYVSANMHSEFSPTYLYYLSKPPAKSYADKAAPGFPAKELGIVSHADELQYMFLYYGYPEIPNGDPEYFEFSRYLVKQWVTFAENGAPTSDWQQISRKTSNSTFWFELNDNPGRTEVMRDRMNFWDQFSHKQLKYE